MPLDGITTYFLTRELNTLFSGAKVDRIYQPTKKDLILHLRNAGKNHRLLLSIDPAFARIHTTSQQLSNPDMPPSFCMVLRKHLTGARIVSVSGPDFERIVEISFNTTNEMKDVISYRLIIEMMGRHSNVIFLNQYGKILDSIFHVDAQMSRVREIMPARQYDYPPLQDKWDPPIALKLLQEGTIPVKESEGGRPTEKAIIGSIKGFSPFLAREICHLAQIDPRKGFRQLDDRDTKNLYNTLSDILTRICEHIYEPVLYQNLASSKPIDFHCLAFEGIGHVDIKASISEAIDAYYLEHKNRNDFIQKKAPLLRFAEHALSHASKKKDIHTSDITASEKYPLYKKWGDLILTYGYQIEPETDSLVCSDYDSPDQMIEIELNPSLSATENAQNYFKKYRKLKTRHQTSVTFLEEDKRAVEYYQNLYRAALQAADEEDLNAIIHEIDYLNARQNAQSDRNNTDTSPATPGIARTGKQKSRAIRSAGRAARIKSIQTGKANKKKSTPKTVDYRRFEAPRDMQILCGRNNLQNDTLTFTVADKNDLWFHAKNMPGAHVILRLFGQTPDDKTIEYAAGIAAYYSSSLDKDMIQPNVLGADAKQHRIGVKIDVDYCPVKHVKKIPGGRPGMVIYSQYNTLSVYPTIDTPKSSE